MAKESEYQKKYNNEILEKIIKKDMKKTNIERPTIQTEVANVEIINNQGSILNLNSNDTPTIGYELVSEMIENEIMMIQNKQIVDSQEINSALIRIKIIKNKITEIINCQVQHEKEVNVSIRIIEDDLTKLKNNMEI